MLLMRLESLLSSLKKKLIEVLIYYCPLLAMLCKVQTLDSVPHLHSGNP